MATRVGVGTSHHHNPSVAGREAAEQGLRSAGIANPDFVFMFATVGYDQHSLLRAVRETTGEAPLSGCSAEGTINGEEADESNFSVVVTAISSDELQWINGLARGLGADSRAVGQRVAQDLLPHLSADTIGLFVFPDGLNLTLYNFFAGLEANLPSERFLPMWGGGAGNNFSVETPTFQYCDDEAITDGVSYALLSGEAQTSWAISHGLIPIGGERIVTRSEGNVIYEIDDKPATEVLKEYLPEHALVEDRDWMHHAISLALCFEAPSYMKDEEYVVRGVPGVRMADGAITVQTEVPEGTSIWFSSRDKEKMTTGLDRMAHQIKEQLEGEKPKLVFQFECMTRGKTMLRVAASLPRHPPPMRSQRIQGWPLRGGGTFTFGVAGGGWPVMFAAFLYFVFRFFTLYGVWWTELLAAVTSIDSTRWWPSARCTGGRRHTTRKARWFIGASLAVRMWAVRSGAGLKPAPTAPANRDLRYRHYVPPLCWLGFPEPCYAV